MTAPKMSTDATTPPASRPESSAGTEQPSAVPAAARPVVERCATCRGAGGHMSCGHWLPCEADECFGTGLVVERIGSGLELVDLSTRLRAIVADDHTTRVPALRTEQHEDVCVAAETIDQLRLKLSGLEFELKHAQTAAQLNRDTVVAAQQANREAKAAAEAELRRLKIALLNDCSEITTLRAKLKEARRQLEDIGGRWAP